MNFVELSESEFNKFYDTQNNSNFFQSLQMKKHLENKKNKCYLFGVKKNKKIILATMITETNNSFLKKKDFYCYGGFVGDLNDYESLSLMTSELKKFVKKNNGIRMVINPYIPLISRDINGDVTDSFDNTSIRNNLIKLGYKEINGDQVKWTFCLDINGKSSDELFKEFNPTHRNIIRKCQNKFNLMVKELSYDELDVFKHITSITSKRRDFADKSLDYYQDMYKCFKDKVKFLLCYIDLDNYINTLEKDNNQINTKLNNLSDAKANDNIKKELLLNITTNNENISYAKELKSKYGNIINLSCAMFMIYNNEVIYLFSGSDETFFKFNGQYYIQYYMIKYAADNKLKRYNFYGIRDFKTHGKGIYEFKRGFNGYVEELIGTYELKTSYLNTVRNMLYKIKHKIKKG